jgi:hypothetical protein
MLYWIIGALIRFRIVITLVLQVKSEQLIAFGEDTVFQSKYRGIFFHKKAAYC